MVDAYLRPFEREDLVGAAAEGLPDPAHGLSGRGAATLVDQVVDRRDADP